MSNMKNIGTRDDGSLRSNEDIQRLLNTPEYNEWLDGLPSALDEEYAKTEEVKANEFDIEENRQ